MIVIKKKEKSVKYGESRGKSKHRKNENSNEKEADSRSNDNVRYGDVFGDENRNENEPKNIDLPNEKEENGANDDTSK